MTEKRRRRRKQLLDDLTDKRRYWKLKKKALSRSHSVENPLWKRLRTCRKTDYGVIMIFIYMSSLTVRLCSVFNRTPCNC
jgi:hypothetical protein